MRVGRFAIAPVKGLGLVHPDEIDLGTRGVPNDRRFYLVQPDGGLVNGKTCGALMQVRPRVEGDGESLDLEFPDGSHVSGEVGVGAPVETSFYGRPVSGHFVGGPWSDALSEFAGRPFRLVRTDLPGTAVDRSYVVSLISDGSLRAVGRHAGVDDVDGRRFRMTIEIEDCRDHEEDEWIGREVQVGEARIRVAGPVGRCAVTTCNPDSGESDLDTLRALASYRTLKEGKSFGCGVCGDVLAAGRVRIGDPVRNAS